MNHDERLAEIGRLKADKERLDAEWRALSEQASAKCREAEAAHVAHINARDAYLNDCGL